MTLVRKFRILIEGNNPGEDIIELIKQINAEIVASGTGAKQRTEMLLFGSTAHYLTLGSQSRSGWRGCDKKTCTVMQT